MRSLKAAALAIVLLSAAQANAQKPDPAPAGFLETANKKVEMAHGITISEACPTAGDIAAKTVFEEYGAVFVAGGGATVPSKCIFSDESEVAAFQGGLKTRTSTIGGVRITLQEAAMDALLAARAEGRGLGLQITPRGTSSAGARGFAETKRLWDTRFLPGLEHWVKEGRISRGEARKAKEAPVPVQVAMVLNWESEGIYFARGFAKSILFSVAAPGSSQHISMLALDVQQYGNKRVRSLLAKHGWFQTVRSDLPHFTYLGVSENELSSLGLKKIDSGGHVFWVPKL
jgi:hypothetical protein